MDRRRFLQLSGVFGAGGLAGCMQFEFDEDAEVSTPTSTDDGSTSEPDGGDQTETGTGNALGEWVTFYREDEDVELTVSAVDAYLSNAFIYSSRNSIFSDVPTGDRLYLAINVEMENVGSEPANRPGEIGLVIDGSQYDTVFSSAFDENDFEPFGELQPGVSTSEWAVFEIPPSDSQARFFMEWGFVEPVSASWQIDLGGIERRMSEYSALTVGESISIGDEDLNYSMAVTNVEEAQQYTYEGVVDESVEEADAGHKFVFTELEVENTGTGQVRLPSKFDVTLVGGNQQFDYVVYYGDGEYEGGEVSSGIIRQGLVPFEIPTEINDYEIQVELTSDLHASWIP